MLKEIEEFNKRFNIETNDNENIRRFKNSLCKILEIQIGNISLKKEFRNQFIKYTGIDYKDFGKVDANTQIDIGEGDFWKNNTHVNYIKFKDTCIGKAFQEDIFNLIKYIQILFLISDDIVPSNIKNNLYYEIDEIIKLYRINVNIIKEDNKYLIYPKGAKELDEALVNEVLLWMKQFDRSKKKYISALKKYQEKDEIRNILDDMRLCLEMFVQDILNNNKTLENNKGEIGKLLEQNGLNKEIKNMYITLFDYFTKYQNNNVKHNEKCYEQEIEFIIYLTGLFIRTLIITIK